MNDQDIKNLCEQAKDFVHPDLEKTSEKTFSVDVKDSKAVYNLILELTEYLHPVHAEELSMEDLVEEMESVVSEYKNLEEK